jgi:hypothetical protein
MNLDDLKLMYEQVSKEHKETFSERHIEIRSKDSAITLEELGIITKEQLDDLIVFFDKKGETNAETI